MFRELRCDLNGNKVHIAQKLVEISNVWRTELQALGFLQISCTANENADVWLVVQKYLFQDYEVRDWRQFLVFDQHQGDS